MRKSKNTSVNTETLLSQLADMLAVHGAPVVSAYDLGRYVFLRGQDAGAQSDAKAVFAELCDALLRVRLLSAIEPYSETRAYLLFGKGNASPAEIVCSLDPFAYVSHLSAMEYHGLTDRFPKILYMTRPALPQWRDQAKARMSKDLGDHLQPYLDSGLPKLIQPKISRLGQTSVQFFERSQLGAFRLVSGSSLRVATIGRVFLEMIREPSLCGGIQHVIDIYKREAGRYLPLIVDEINQHGLPIDKVRLGFLLSEVCGLDHPVLSEWEKLAQRGGSRKLDPEGEYLPVFSERWQLSLNVPSLFRSADDA
jgi:hypothetical protein